MNKEFITYEQALALKELGFDEPCFGMYYTKSGVLRERSYCKNSDFTEPHQIVFVSAPLKQQAFRWFREKYQLHGFMFTYSNSWQWKIDLINISPEDYSREIEYKTYEEAESACLDKLIEIVRLSKP
jgi:hypothetical protein